jgi:hypothetical protein
METGNLFMASASHVCWSCTGSEPDVPAVQKIKTKFLAAPSGSLPGDDIRGPGGDLCQGQDSFRRPWYRPGYWITVIAFSAELPSSPSCKLSSYENPHELKNIIWEECPEQAPVQEILRMGMFSAWRLHSQLSEVWHLYAVLSDPPSGFASPYCCHPQIPEGVAVDIPIYYATKQKEIVLAFHAPAWPSTGACWGTSY